MRISKSTIRQATVVLPVLLHLLLNLNHMLLGSFIDFPATLYLKSIIRVSPSSHFISTILFLYIHFL